MKIPLIIPLFASLGFLLAGCASNAANYTFVYLKTGPESGSKTPEESTRIFQGHMANIHRIADERKLLIAGPFDTPGEKTWRGIFILDVPSTDAAREVVNSDPGIQSGVFIQEDHPFTSTVDLRRTIKLEKQLNANIAANPNEPPKNIRGYVMITAANASKARAAIASSLLSKSIIFSGTFTDTHAAVFVLDSPSAKNIHDVITNNHIDIGPCSVDGWWSTTSLTGLGSSTTKDSTRTGSLPR